jgi:hypothetical protein
VLHGLNDPIELWPYSTSLSRFINRKDGGGDVAPGLAGYLQSLGNFIMGKGTHNDRVHVAENGVKGEAARNMTARLSGLLQSLPQTRVVIILAGTNDLVGKAPPRNIVRSILQLHKLALEFSLPATSSSLVASTHTHSSPHSSMQMYTVLVTLPQIRYPVRQEDRLVVNDGLRSFTRQCPQRVALVDIESAWDQAVPENAKFWSADFTHLSKAGYADLARLIFQAMQSFQVKGKGKGKGKDRHAPPCPSKAYDWIE